MAKYGMTALKSWALSGGFPAKDASTAAAVAMAESGGDSTVVSKGAGAVGLWQILPSTAKGVGQSDSVNMLKNPLYNATTAAKIYKRYGWTQWDAYKNGSYKRHLDEAEDAGGFKWGGEDSELFDNPVQGLEDIGAASRDLVRAGQWIANPQNLIRVVYVVGGGVLIVAGASALAKPAWQPVLSQTRGAVAKIATKGKVKAK